ncbi:PI-actitoxin-Avd5a-like [Aphomia sociella]
MNFLYAFTIFVLFAMAMGTAAQICTAQYDPVCATNGRTYSNSCQMKNAGAKLKHKGECNKSG